MKEQEVIQKKTKEVVFYLLIYFKNISSWVKCENEFSLRLVNKKTSLRNSLKETTKIWKGFFIVESQAIQKTEELSFQTLGSQKGENNKDEEDNIWKIIDQEFPRFQEYVQSQ